jgi:hypothetical protein
LPLRLCVIFPEDQAKLQLNELHFGEIGNCLCNFIVYSATLFAEGKVQALMSIRTLLCFDQMVTVAGQYDQKQARTLLYFWNSQLQTLVVS